MRTRYTIRCWRDHDLWTHRYDDQRWLWYVSLSESGEDSEPILTQEDCTLRRALRSVLDEAYVERRIRVVRIITLDSYTNQPTSDRIVRLRSSTSRRRQIAERRVRLAAERRARAARRRKEEAAARTPAAIRARAKQAIHLRRAHDLAARICSTPQPRNIRHFGRMWRAVTGYGRRNSAVRAALAPAKNAIVRLALDLAHQHGWVVGCSHDELAQSEYSDIVYIDSPLGQMSFHVRPGAYGTYPSYGGSWSGQRNSLSILARLVDGVVRLPDAA